jgi:hypothetical protein
MHMRKNLKERLAATAAVMMLGLGLSAARADLMKNLPAVQDATLLGGSDSTTNNSLADPGMFVGTDGQGNAKRGLIEFNIAGAIPANATITGVTLTLTEGQSAGSGGANSGPQGPQTITLFDETQSWGQPTNVAGATSFGGNGHGKAPANGDATWNYAFYNSTPANATAWTVAGGNWTTSSTAIATNTGVTTTLQAYTWSSTAMITDVQNWLDTPADNFGWLIKNSDEVDSTDFRAFWGAEGAAANNDPGIAPNLLVSYIVVPEPVGLSVLAAGALLLCRRRRAGSC